MKSNIIIAVAGVLTFVFFLIVSPNDIVIEILLGFSAVGIGSTIKFLVLNIPKIYRRQN